jgi:glycosyltransferase involved in cell wall biosynthesis
MARLADKVIAVSKEVRDELISLTNMDRRTIEVIPNGVNPNEFMPSHNQSFRNKYNIGECPLILYVGRMSLDKGVDYFLKVAALVRERVPNAKFVLVGPTVFSGKVNDNIPKQLADLCNKLHLKDDVIFTGGVTYEELKKIYSSADCFVLSSRSEGMPLAVLEALSSGLPVIAMNAEGIQDVIKDGENGFIVEKGDILKMSEKIVSVISDKNLRSYMSSKARQTIIRYFTWEEIAMKTLKLYREIVR